MTAASLTFGNISTMLFRRRRAVLSGGIVFAIIGFIIYLMVARTYTSIGGMIVENGEPNVPELGMGIGNANANPEGVVLTQVEVLHSFGLIKQVVDDLGLNTAPDLRPVAHWPANLTALWERTAPWRSKLPKWPLGEEKVTTESTVEFVRRHLRVEATEHSSVITIQFPAGSSKQAVAMVDGLMRAYLNSDVERRAAQINQVNEWLSARSNSLNQDAEIADDEVKAFIAAHEVTEVGGSSSAALQLNADQIRLAEAKQRLVRQLALSEAIARGAADTDEVLNSRTIQMYKERDVQMVQQIATLTPTDPRRDRLQQALVSIRAQLAFEKGQIASSIKHNVDVARADVGALEAELKKGEKRESMSAQDGATLANLRSVAAAKKQLFVAFGTRSEQTRLAAAQLPSARVLYSAFALPQYSTAAPSTVVGFFAGACLIGSIVVLREALRNRVISSEQVANVTGLPVLASLPELNWRKPFTPMITETMRAMWWNALSSGTSGVVITVTSSEIGEGKTTLTTTLSRRIAADGGRVLVIDADLRRRGLAATFSLAPRAPLGAVLRGEVSVQAVIHRDVSGVDCFLPDASVDNPVAVFQSVAFRQLLEESRSTYDVVFLDTPPVLRVTDAVILAKLSDHVLFVVGAGRVATDFVGEAVNRFAPEERAKIVTVLTRVPRGDLQARDYFKGYGVS